MRSVRTSRSAARGAALSPTRRTTTVQAADGAPARARPGLTGLQFVDLRQHLHNARRVVLYAVQPVPLADAPHDVHPLRLTELALIDEKLLSSEGPLPCRFFNPHELLIVPPLPSGSATTAAAAASSKRVDLKLTGAAAAASAAASPRKAVRLLVSDSGAVLHSETLCVCRLVELTVDGLSDRISARQFGVAKAAGDVVSASSLLDCVDAMAVDEAHGRLIVVNTQSCVIGAVDLLTGACIALQQTPAMAAAFAQMDVSMQRSCHACLVDGVLVLADLKPHCLLTVELPL